MEITGPKRNNFDPQFKPKPQRVGLGHFRLSRPFEGAKYLQWVYICPNGDEYGVNRGPCVTDETSATATPPPVPKPDARQCDCYEGPHTCSHCGTPHFIEIHGFADGFCSYCYYRG